MVWATAEDIFDVRMRSRIVPWVKTPESKMARWAQKPDREMDEHIDPLSLSLRRAHERWQISRFLMKAFSHEAVAQRSTG